MWPNPQFPADLVTFTEKIFNGKRHLSVGYSFSVMVQLISSQCFLFIPPANITKPLACWSFQDGIEREYWLKMGYVSYQFRSSPSEVFLGKGVLKICSKFTPMSKWNFNKVALQLYWNRTSAQVFSCKFAVYFQNTFF